MTNETTKPEAITELGGRVDSVVSCGKCEKSWDNDDFIEMQECLHKRDIGGYGSVFGDGQEWEIILCQKCARELLEPYIKWR